MAYGDEAGTGLGRAVAVTALGAAVACAPDDEPPELVAVEFVDAGTLVLRFSEPIGAIAEVDPATHFRVGTALVIDDGAGGRLTAYYDLAHHFPDGLPGVEGEPSARGRWFRHGFTFVGELERGDSPDELRAHLTYPIEVDVCDALVEAQALGIPAAIHLHYAEASFPRITDEAGNPLADIGGWWVSSAFASSQPGEFPLLDPRMPIPCPDEPHAPDPAP